MPRQKQQYIGTHKVTQLPSGSYNVRIKVNGKNHSFSAETVRELRQLVEEFEATGHQAVQQTFGQSVDDYIETCQLQGRSPSTIRGYMYIRKSCLGNLADLRTDRITVLDVQKAINAYSREHSPKSVHNQFGLIHRVLSIVRPNLDLRTIALPQLDNDVNDDAGIVIPDHDMIRYLLDYTREHDIEMYKAILIASLLGLRRSEMCALKWQDIDLTFGNITINKAVVMGHDKQYYTKATKSRAGKRILPMARPLVNILRGLAGDPDAHVINLTPGALTDRYCHLRDRLNIPGCFHDLRHYHASVMIALNVPQLYAMRDMGQSTPGLYKRVYAHMFPDTKADMYDALKDHTAHILDDKVTQKVPRKA